MSHAFKDIAAPELSAKSATELAALLKQQYAEAYGKNGSDQELTKLIYIHRLLQEKARTYEDYLAIAVALKEVKTIKKHYYLLKCLELCDSLERIKEVYPLFPSNWNEERMELIRRACTHAKTREELVDFLLTCVAKMNPGGP